MGREEYTTSGRDASYRSSNASSTSRSSNGSSKKLSGTISSSSNATLPSNQRVPNTAPLVFSHRRLKSRSSDRSSGTEHTFTSGEAHSNIGGSSASTLNALPPSRRIDTDDDDARGMMSASSGKPGSIPSMATTPAQSSSKAQSCPPKTRVLRSTSGTRTEIAVIPPIFLSPTSESNQGDVSAIIPERTAVVVDGLQLLQASSGSKKTNGSFDASPVTTRSGRPLLQRSSRCNPQINLEESGINQTASAAADDSNHTTSVEDANEEEDKFRDFENLQGMANRANQFSTEDLDDDHTFATNSTAQELEYLRHSKSYRTLNSYRSNNSRGSNHRVDGRRRRYGIVRRDQMSLVDQVKQLQLEREASPTVLELERHNSSCNASVISTLTPPFLLRNTTQSSARSTGMASILTANSRSSSLSPSSIRRHHSSSKNQKSVRRRNSRRPFCPRAVSSLSVETSSTVSRGSNSPSNMYASRSPPRLTPPRTNQEGQYRPGNPVVYELRRGSRDGDKSRRVVASRRSLRLSRNSNKKQAISALKMATKLVPSKKTAAVILLQSDDNRQQQKRPWKPSFSTFLPYHGVQKHSFTKNHPDDEEDDGLWYGTQSD